MRSPVPLALLLLGGCAAGPDRGLNSLHQPLVAADHAYVPGCPDWNTAGKPGHESQSSNYGCATQSNLAAMVAEPADLLHGRSDDAGGYDVAAKAVKAWREAPASSSSWTKGGADRNASGGEADGAGGPDAAPAGPNGGR